MKGIENMDNMKIKEEYDIPEGFEIPDHIDMWYDSHLKLWTLQTKDKYNNQIGEVEYAKGKQSAMKANEELESKLKVSELVV